MTTYSSRPIALRRLDGADEPVGLFGLIPSLEAKGRLLKKGGKLSHHGGVTLCRARQPTLRFTSPLPSGQTARVRVSVPLKQVLEEAHKIRGSDVAEAH